jgi:hypothetical protein
MQPAKGRYTKNDRAQRKKWYVFLGSFNQKGAKQGMGVRLFT